jgi:hypothetical protein
MCKLISKIILPKTESEKEIISNNDFLKGMAFGLPRKGHPEGQVIFHIIQVLENVNKYSTSEDQIKLRLIALIHDSFKYKCDFTKPKKQE